MSYPICRCVRGSALCHRYEPSGALHGIMRVRGFVRTTPHIFCTEEQIIPETERFVKLLSEVIAISAFDSLHGETRHPPDTARRQGSRLRIAPRRRLELACHRNRHPVHAEPGRGHLLWPQARVRAARRPSPDWQCGTIQIDYVLPERLDAEIPEEGNRKRPVMLHRAILGSLERFIGRLDRALRRQIPRSGWHRSQAVCCDDCFGRRQLRHRGRLPALKASGLRAELDVRNEKINYKVANIRWPKCRIFWLQAGVRPNAHLCGSRLGSEAQKNLALADVDFYAYSRRLRRRTSGPKPLRKPRRGLMSSGSITRENCVASKQEAK